MYNDALLKVRDLKTVFHTSKGVVEAVNGVSFDVKRGEILAIVGESGCGKSVTSLSILDLIDYPGEIVSGEVFLENKEIFNLSKEELRSIRGKGISIIFQNPMTSLDPIIDIGTQIIETIMSHEDVNKKEAQIRAINTLNKLGFRNPKRLLRKYPFELSGGMNQRVMIAMALCLNPKVLIADEPTTALDMTVQAQILLQLKYLKEELNAGIILITHDLGVVAQLADEVAVMYAGSIVEYGRVDDIFHSPAHPYTKGLLESIHDIGKNQALNPMSKQPPSLLNLPKGCSFISRCPLASKKCKAEMPELKKIGKDHKVACFQL
ncbi:ABC transporter ATP-binding protein [Sporohalobacter salinus]|uniref:ABC transporter ATP-binding protein n=1 Tax=Sporohalobacter salinus TaxID=1494606 RepID=UPI001960C900|nr:ABC transporter ATP-binding protein [Sporohalobacter salinus]MBM7624404.1 oligopeptide/dipeptide ABC transporter ATP-binding protein [Sporohalobacter salinus]